MATAFPTTTRRRFLQALAAVTGASAAGALGYASIFEPHWCELVRRDMPVVGLPASWNGRTLLHLSDLHIGSADADYLDEALRQASGLSADLVVVTGDLMSYRTDEQVEDVARRLSVLRSSPHGVFASFGNHDYGHGWSQPWVADALERRLTVVGVRALRCESVELDGLRLVGLEDLWCPRFKKRETAQMLRDVGDAPAIVLGHNPDVCDLPIWGDFRGWILAGHTHGGQCRPPFLPAPWVPVQNRRYSRGEIDLGDGRTLYVSRGLGYKWRVRFNVRPEMTLFTLRTA